MNTEEIRQDLLRRAKEMREMDPSNWAKDDPRIMAPGKECAIMRHSDHFEAHKLISLEAREAVVSFLISYKDGAFGQATNLSGYNDRVAKSPTDVAILLEKCAANL